MTENDPTAQDRQAATPEEPGTVERGGWPAQDDASTPPRGVPAAGGQPAPGAWSPGAEHQADAQPSQQQPLGAESQGTNPYAGPGQAGGYPAAPGMSEQVHYPSPMSSTATMYPQPPGAQPRKSGGGKGPGKLVAGVALLALLLGGGAGGAAGYLVAGDATSGGAGNSLDAPQPAKQTGNAPAGSVESVAQKVLPSVVQLQVTGRAGSGEGSGFVISEDGYILTNNHVVQAAADGGQIQVAFQNGDKAKATIVGRDPTTDIAVVRAEGVSGLTPAELGRSDDLNVGQGVVAIGSPFSLAGTVTSGIVSSLHRPVSAGGGGGDQATVMDAVQTDAAINPGNSGGPLVNMSGQVIGINSAIYSPQSGGLPGQQSEGGNVGIGFAIPIDQARRTAEDIIDTGQAKQTYIGARVGNSPQGGAVLGEIEPDSPAEKAGLKPGDVITKIGDRPIEDANTLVAAIRTKAPNESVTFTLASGDTVDVTLGGKPVEAN
ncbi:putative serine protease PepD [Amycolatopsis marina]|uniref:Putative serine protease PepD n=1 Tax=Amycolatopsis marina TaxID=490629 RepID=A0A1I1BIF9_9PSEU|nr:trypsin-like peptidase domain-containing protein [Amycolatopsis marina]SFB48280.1 putative serine protease PepD [Amycolatopsis marina]